MQEIKTSHFAYDGENTESVVKNFGLSVDENSKTSSSEKCFERHFLQTG